jgi:SAM-dependent methyltransferase
VDETARRLGATSAVGPLTIPLELSRSNSHDPAMARESALWLLDDMRDHLGLPDFSASEVLDYGCGVKFSEVLINLGIPIKRYVGVDVHEGLIDFLGSHVDDPRFEYHHVNVHNAMYNPSGEPLTAETELPFGPRRFDVICLFSVFTHLAPHDFRALLTILRRHIKDVGRLFFTLYIFEFTRGGHGLIDMWGRMAFRDDDPRIAAAMENAASTNPEELVAHLAPDFVDLDPKFPLRWAVYSERHARELIEGAGWRILSLSPPYEHVQHHCVCAPL